MIKIKFIAFDGVETEIEAEQGLSLMQAAIKNDVPGIVAECGGSCCCATCHVYIDEQWFETLPPKENMEEDMLEFAAVLKETSRLSCQIKLSEELNGIVVHTPETQY